LIHFYKRHKCFNITLEVVRDCFAMDWFTLLVTNLVLGVQWVTGSQLDVGECLALGFNSAKLLCSSCEELKQFDLGSVVGECKGCCSDDGGSAKLEGIKYEKAILEVCG